jgi:non-heme chloroperoxidase
LHQQEEFMPYLKTQSSPATELFYYDQGEGQPVVLIHGWPLNHRMWESQINALTEAGYRCIAYDRRGFGESGRANQGYDYDTFASDLNDLINHLDLHDVVLAGFSMGGGEVARYIGNYGSGRIAKAMLLGSVTPFLLQTADNATGVDKEVFDGMIQGVRKNRVAFLADFLNNFYNIEDTGDANPDLIPYSKWLAWQALPVATQECITAFGTTDFRQDLEKFDVPTLIVHGDADRIVPLDISAGRAHEMIRDSRLEIIPGAPHGFAATHAEQLNELMINFLRS